MKYNKQIEKKKKHPEIYYFICFFILCFSRKVQKYNRKAKQNYVYIGKKKNRENKTKTTNKQK